VVRGEGQRKRDAPVVAVEVQHDLLDAAPRSDEDVDVLDGGVALGHPRRHVGDEALERGCAPDAPAHRVMELGLPGE
jgi:hypothetical protein